MNTEGHPEPPKTNEEHFEAIERLLAEGWTFEGNFFQKDQTYRLIVRKEGEEDRIFITTRPFPKIVDATGKVKESPYSTS